MTSFEGQVARPVDKPCRVRDCTRTRIVTLLPNGRWKSRALCAPHEQRRTRLGSELARTCAACGRVVIDEQQETHVLERDRTRRCRWRCMDCLVADRRGAVGNGARRKA